jgi:hypothetical protein
MFLTVTEQESTPSLLLRDSEAKQAELPIRTKPCLITTTTGSTLKSTITNYLNKQKSAAKTSVGTLWIFFTLRFLFFWDFDAEFTIFLQMSFHLKIKKF